ncbi:MAG: DEAD/DEAH box helicase [Calothrix sp. SM1_7_51]|nr:DEAD/DEAH box helicase [Calothrix sp. SM1_7_51]
MLNRSDKNIPENSYTFKQLEDLTCFFVSDIGEVPPQSAQPTVNVERNVLDYFARRYFLVPELKQEQFKLIQKALENKSVLGLLPTGFGKSLVFQLYTLLIPRTTLVISPLRVLIHDQVYNLKRLGLNCVEFILTGDSILQRSQKLNDFSDGRYRILYIAPERLQTTEFWEFWQSLVTENQRLSIGALVIDEVHCVSELGHDFRPAYLQIPKLQKFLAENNTQEIPIIALSATASEAVIKDIMCVLKLSGDGIIKLANRDRSELSISVHSVETPEDKPGVVARLIQEVIPQILNIKFTDLIPYNQNPPYENAGLIFGLYADSQGKRTFVEGVHNIAYEIRKKLGLDSRLVQVHANRAPECCPQCGSPVIQNETHKIQHKKQEVCRCFGLWCCFSPFGKKEIFSLG